MLCDCHVHFASYESHELPGVVQRASDARVDTIITAGTTLETSETCVTLAKSYGAVYAAIGVHPVRLRGFLDEQSLERLESLARGERKVVAWSETGMDYLGNAPELKWQEQAFRAQIRLARTLRLPLVWHSRVPEPGVMGQHAETFRILKEEHAGEVGGVMHYFQADEATAWQAIDTGSFISFAKPLLRLPHLTGVARAIPLEHIVLETDASPQPWKPNRAGWTEPKDVALVAQRLAEIKGVSVEEVAEATTANLVRLLGWPLQPDVHATKRVNR